MDGQPLGTDVTVRRYRTPEITRYPEHMRDLPVVLIDFDGVLATNTWPSPALGQPDPEAIRLIQHYTEQGCEVHIFTARPEDHFSRIWAWLRGQQIDHLVYSVTNKKLPASVYIDDRCYNWGDIKNGR